MLVAAARGDSLAGASRYAAARAVLPDPLGSPTEFAEGVRRLVREHDVRVVLPTTEEAVLALVPIRESLGAVLPLPSTDRFIDVNDKGALLARAAELGVAVPGQHVLADSAAPLPDDLRFPLVAKPSRSTPLGQNGRQKLEARHVASRQDLDELLRSAPRDSFPLLLQQKITGRGIGLFFLVWNGAVVARFAHRRLREKPPSGGVSVLCESTVASSALEDKALALLGSDAWRGVAMVEFKQDDATGTPYLMEINARFWGSLQLAIDAGVDFPRLLVECALGRVPTTPVVGRAGQRLRWWFGDLDHLIIRLKSERGIRSCLRALGTFLSGGRGARNEILRADDWRPALREMLDWGRRR